MKSTHRHNRRDLIGLAWQSGRGSTALLFLTIVIGGVGPAVFMLLVGVTVGRLPEAARLGFNDGAGRVAGPVAAASAVFLVTQVAGKIRFAVGEILGQRIEITLRERAMRACSIDDGLDHLQDDRTRDDLAILSGAAGGLPLERAVAGLAEVTSALVGAVGPLLLLMFFHVWAGAAVALAWFAVRIVAGRENGKRLELLFGQAHVMRRAEYFRKLAVQGAAAKEIRVFGLRDWVLARLDQEWLAAIRPTWRRRRPSDAKILLLSCVLVAVYGLVFWRLVDDGVNGGLETGAFAVFLQALIGASAVSGGTAAFGLDVALAPVSAVRRLEERKAAASRGAAARTAKDLTVRRLELRDVTFAYDSNGGAAVGATADGTDAAANVATERGEARGESRDESHHKPHDKTSAKPRSAPRPVLDGVSFSVAAGESVALVGENGAGKTTLLKLLAGLLEPVSGRIEADGVALHELGRADWRRHLAMVFQDFARLPLTVAENVHVLRADSGDEQTRKTVLDCLQRVGLGERVARLPHGIDTVLGARLPGGIDFSGGEWQRLALARAFFTLHQGARVLLVDEPTASIDPSAETEFFDRLLDETEGMIRIVVSHRFNTVRRVDRIVVLDRGRVVESGSHDDLMRQDGLYRRMFLAQAAPFTEQGGVR
ncbi:Vitamin B12 import ATP-binding protein BtuD [Streptomyces sp. enrichment culture]|uniref:ABC transporter ATP-binding protein n=1 Tax=Streptomyces sp. enrichment culture TaxID=1795815 RepID=UPI003F5572F7